MGGKFPGGQTERGYRIRLAFQVMKVKVATSNMLWKVDVALKLQCIRKWNTMTSFFLWYISVKFHNLSLVK